MRAQVGLEDAELALNHNTLLNRALSYRLELSPSRYNSCADEPMPFPSQYQHHEHQGFQRRSSTEDLSLSFEGAFRPDDEPARKRSRGESGNSQGSSDNSVGDAVGSQVVPLAFEDAETATEKGAKQVRFTSQPPVEIPPESPRPCAEAPATTWGNAVGSSDEAAAPASPGSLALGMGGLATLSLPLTGSPQDACS